MSDTIPKVLPDILHRFSPDASTRPIILVHQRLSRGIINHQDLIAALQAKFGTTHDILIFKGTEALKEIIAMHHVADLIIGPHGAGLSNMIFSNSHRIKGIIELHPSGGNVGVKKAPNLCHQESALALGIPTVQLMQKDGKSFGAAFRVDVQQVLDHAEKMLLPAPSPKQNPM